MIRNELNLAAQPLRFLNVVIDMVVFLVIWFFSAVVLMILGLDQTFTDETGEPFPIVPIITLIPIFWGYYILTEYYFQRTLGKVLTQTKVVSETGDKPTLKQITIRTLCRSIPMEYVSYLASPEGLHDKLSKTRVVKK